MPNDRHCRDPQPEDPRKHPQANSRGKDHTKENRKKDERCTEIRLLEHKQERHADIGSDGEEFAKRVDLPAALFEHRCERNDHDEF